MKARHKIRSGFKVGFRPGYVPHNKGKKKWWTGGEETQFKTGQMPWNYKPVGSERVVDGYTEVKIADPKTWKSKHVLIWEAANGPVPKDHVVIFGDRNKQNMSLDNLLLVSRREMAVMNKKGLISTDADLTKAGIKVAGIVMRIRNIKRRL